LVQQGLNAAVAIGNGPMSSFYGPSLSPDKSSVVVIQSTVSAGQPSINDLYLYKTSGGMQTGTQITHGGQIGGGTPYGPSCIWNPQGTKILFTNTDSSIWEVGVNGSGLTQISPSSAVLNGFPIEPSWSPDGTKISFGENNSVYVVNADGSNPQNVYTLPTGNNNGATSGHFFAGTTWGLDSSYVYFIDAAQLDPNIPTITSSFYKVPPTTGNSPTLVSTLTWTVAPAFSPSGQMVASLVLGAGFLGPVQSMGLTGANQVTVDNGQDFRWTKNNQLVIYDGQGGLWLASPTSGAAETLIVQLPSPGVQIFSGFDAR
jgi:Tol biopolymer transport system component